MNGVSPGGVGAGSVARRVEPPRWVVVPAALAIALMPLLKPGGPGNSSPVDVLIALAIAATFLWAAVSQQPVRLPYVVPIGVLIAAGSLAGLAGAFPELSVIQLIQDLVLFLWCAVIVKASPTPGALRALLRIWCWSGLAWAAFLIGAYTSGHQDLAGVTAREGTRASLTFGDPNLASSYFLLTIIVIWTARCPGRLWLRVVATATILVAMVLTGSNGAFLSLLVGAAGGVIFWLLRRHGAAAAVSTACVCGLFIFGVASIVRFEAVQSLAENSGQPLLRDSLGRSDQSIAQRVTILSEISDLHAQSTLLGWGPRSTKAVLQSEQVAYPKEAHNDYIASFVERGPLGSLGLLLFVASLTWRMSTIASRDRSRYVSAAGLAPAPMLAAVVAIGIEATNEQVLHFRHVWVIFAVIAAASIWHFTPGGIATHKTPSEADVVELPAPVRL